MVTDVGLGALVETFGRNHAQAVWDAGLAAIARIEASVGELEIDCEFERIDGYLHAPASDRQRDDRASFAEDASLANELGFDAEFVSSVPFVNTPGVRFDNQARFHPRKYLAGLTAAIRERDGLIFEHSDTEEFCDEPLRVKSRGHWLRANDLVIATHNPVVGTNSLAAATVFQTKLALYTSYVVAGRVRPGIIPDALYWDTADPYKYIRLEPHRDYDLVILGGEDHKTGQVTDTEECFARLERDLIARVPDVTVTHRWSGQVIETPDGLPYIGRMADHQYAATGFSGNGMTFGTLSAMMIADLIQERRNPWTDLFDPGRAAIRHGLWNYVTENTDYPYYLIRDRFAGADGKSLRAVTRGEGRVLERNGAKIAAYRDPRGTLTVRSAICTHMGCTVAWNPPERTWDCPCHGSRFTPKGAVISGPAESPLPEVSK